MITRMIYTSFWCDDYVRNLPDLEARLFLFFLTNEKVNLSGIYNCPDFYTLSLFPNLNQDRLNKVKEKFTADKKIIFSEGWVYIANSVKYNDYYKSDKTKKPLFRELSLIPLRVYSFFNDTLSIPYRYPIDTPIINHNQLYNNQSYKDQEVKPKDSPIDKTQDYKEIPQEIVDRGMSKLRDVMKGVSK